MLVPMFSNEIKSIREERETFPFQQNEDYSGLSGQMVVFLSPLSHKLTIHLVHEWDEMSRNGGECHQTNKPFINIYCSQMCNSQCLNVVWFYLFRFSRWTSLSVYVSITCIVGDLREAKRHLVVNQCMEDIFPTEHFQLNISENIMFGRRSRELVLYKRIFCSHALSNLHLDMSWLNDLCGIFKLQEEKYKGMWGSIYTEHFPSDQQYRWLLLLLIQVESHE